MLRNGREVIFIWRYLEDFVILRCESEGLRAGEFTVEKFGCLQPPEKMLKLQRTAVLRQRAGDPTDGIETWRLHPAAAYFFFIVQATGI